MKIHRFYFVLLMGMIGLATSVPAENLSALEDRVKADLVDVVNRILNRSEYSLQVVARVDTVTEKKITEGELLSLQPPKTESKEEDLPEMPGFQVDHFPKAATQEPTTPGETTRQFFKNVDKEVLGKIWVNLVVDETLPDSLKNQVKELIVRRLSVYGPKAEFTMTPVTMRRESKQESDEAWSLNVIIAALLTALAIGVGFLLMRSFRSKQKRSEIGIHSAGVPVPGADAASTEADASAFHERRAALMTLFLTHTGNFKSYFAHLSKEEKSELCGILDGPGFRNLVTGLDFEFPETPVSMADSERGRKIQSFIRSFNEFVALEAWQSDRFFGFLKSMSDDQMITLVRTLDPLDAAVVLRFVKASTVARVLESILPEERLKLMARSIEAKHMEVSQILKIEASVRDSIRTIPKDLGSLNQADARFWTEILMNSDAQEVLLKDLEASMPALYQKLKKFSFGIEDVARLPKERIRKVLEQFDNERLAKALVSTTGDTLNVLLSNLPEERRSLVESQIQVLGDLPEEDRKSSARELLGRFREVAS